MAPATHTVVGAFQPAVVARYADDLDWGLCTTWAFTLFVASLVAVGVGAWVLSAREAEEAGIVLAGP